MTLRLSRRAAALTPSSTASVGRAVKALKAAGVDVVDFGVGEPDFGTPEFVGRAGIAATSSFGPSAQPRRQPVIAYVFDAAPVTAMRSPSSSQ